MVSAVGYDTKGDSAVELVRLGSDGPSVLRRVTRDGQPGAVIWRTEGEAGCPPYCGVGLEYSKKLDGYVVTVNVGTSRYARGCVYFVSHESGQRLIARMVRQSTPDYPEEDKVEPGVVGFRQFDSPKLAADDEHLVVYGVREGSTEAKAYVLDVVKGGVTKTVDGMMWGAAAQGCFPAPGRGGFGLVRSRDRCAELLANGEIVIYEAGEPKAPSPGAPVVDRPERAVEFKGCATDKPTVNGIWPTKRGTFMTAVDCFFKTEPGGDIRYRLAHCLYEVE